MARHCEGKAPAGFQADVAQPRASHRTSRWLGSIFTAIGDSRMTRSSILSAFAAGLLTIATAAGASAETLVVCTEASPDFLNPQFSNQNTAYHASPQIYKRLVGTEPGGWNF